MTGWQAFWIFLAIGFLWTLAWATVAVRSGGPVLTYEEVSAGAARLRRRLAYVVLPVLAIAWIVSLRWYPYPSFAARRVGPPVQTVEVHARQWVWEMTATTLPANRPVEFAVTAVDVNHGFGIYGPSGKIVAQVQAMPRYVNRLILSFPESGTYTIRCLEFCGIPHHGMVATFEVR